MPNATTATTTLTSPQTAAGVIAAIETSGLAAGLGNTVFDSYTDGSSNLVRVFELVTDITKAKGKIYLQILLSTTNVLTTRIYDTWNTVTKTGTNITSGATIFTLNYSNGQNILISSVNHPEYRGIIVRQGTINIGYLGIFRPFNKPTWWDESLYPYAFIINNTNSQLLNHTPCTLNPTGSVSSNSILSNNSIGLVNPINNRREIIKGLLLLANIGVPIGSTGKTSDDLVFVAATGLSPFDVIQVTIGSEEYLLLQSGAPGVAIRIV
jgi:hypothetical protein